MLKVEETVNITIERKAYKPIGQQVKEQLRKMIEKNVYKEEEILPPVIYFQKLLGTSHKPIRKALLDLKEEGLVYSKQGSGWYVAKRKTAGQEERMTSRDILKNMPLAFVVRKEITVGLLDNLPGQTKMWQDVFAGAKKIDANLDVRLLPAQEAADADIIQATALQLRENREKHVELGQFKEIGNLDFSDMFDVYLKSVKTEEGIWGLPAYLSVPLVFLNGKHEKDFQALSASKEVSWKALVSTCIDLSLTRKSVNSGFVLSYLSPLLYFSVNGAEPYRAEKGKIILNLEDKKVMGVFQDLRRMAESHCYVDRTLARHEVRSEELFIKGKVPIMESFLFHRFFLRDAGVKYRILNLPRSKDGRIPVNCSYWTIPSSSKKKQLSAQILGYLMSREAQTKMAYHDHIPILKSIAYSKHFSPPKADNKSAQIAAIERGVNFEEEESVFFTFLQTVFNDQLDRFLNGAQTVEETLGNLKREAVNWQ